MNMDQAIIRVCKKSYQNGNNEKRANVAYRTWNELVGNTM